MSYTKMNKEIEKYLKENNLPCCGKNFDTKEETEKRINAYYRGRDFIFNKWLKEQKYKELISVAHQGWFSEGDFLLPLAKYFVKEKELSWLQFLYEKIIRFNIKDTLSCLKFVKENVPMKNTLEILSEVNLFDFEKYKDGKLFNHIGELKRYYIKALNKLDQYIGFSEQMDCREYLERINELKNKPKNLTVKSSNLNIEI
jgi:hypothetical protein